MLTTFSYWYTNKLLNLNVTTDWVGKVLFRGKLFHNNIYVKFQRNPRPEIQWKRETRVLKFVRYIEILFHPTHRTLP